MASRASVGLCLLAVLWAGAASAQTADRSTRIRDGIAVALANIQHARCTGVAFCEPATAAELNAPPLTVEEGWMVLRRGTINGVAKACGLDWQGKSLAPMMAYWRSLGKTDRQLALIGILHGMAQAQAEAKMAALPCDEGVRNTINAQLSFQP